MTLQPGAMVRLKDIDNLRVLATKKGLILEAANNGRGTIKLAWKSKASAKAAAKAAKAAAKAAKVAAKVGASSVQAKSLATSAKSMAASADALAKAAKSLAVPAKTAATAGATKVAAATAMKATAGTIWAGTGMSLGLGLGLGALGPVLVLGALAASTGGIYYMLRRVPAEPLPEH